MQSSKSPEKGRIYGRSENNSLSCRLSGGGASHLRTRLCPVPVNREKYRENTAAFSRQASKNLDSIGIFRFFWRTELIRNSERTGKEQGIEQGLNREITPAAPNSFSAVLPSQVRNAEFSKIETAVAS
jgi:hypothetical protein